MHILAIPGSLRSASLNRAFCRAAARLAPAGVNLAVYGGLADLPLFNPDREAAPPAVVQAWRTAVAGTDALLIASPEYAHGIAGAMKNALDWLVSFEGFVGKPVAVVNLAPRAHHADDALREILVTMSATLVVPASVTVALARAMVDEDAMCRSAAVSAEIRRILQALADHRTQRYPA